MHGALADRRVVRGVAAAAGGIHKREVGQVVVGAEFEEQAEDLVEHLQRPGIRSVDFIDHHHGPQSALERFGEHKPRLRHGALGSVDEHQRAVGHPEHPFHLATEVGVARRVHDVDLRALPLDRDVFREDRDTPLLFQIVGVEHPLRELAGAVLTALLQQAIDQRGLAVVDVGDDRDVAEIVAANAGGGSLDGGRGAHGGKTAAAKPSARGGRENDLDYSASRGHCLERSGGPPRLEWSRR